MTRIMIVDDERLHRQGLVHMLDWQGQGFEIVAEAGNGQEALDKIPGCRPDIIITDIKMPVMDGIRLTERVRESHPGIRMVILSNYGEFEFVKGSLKAGAADYILKPNLDVPELLQPLLELKRGLETERGRLGPDPGPPQAKPAADCANHPEPGLRAAGAFFEASGAALAPAPPPAIDYQALSGQVAGLDFRRIAAELKSSIEGSIAEGRAPDPNSVKSHVIEHVLFVVHRLEELGFQLGESAHDSLGLLTAIEKAATWRELEAVFLRAMSALEEETARRQTKEIPEVLRKVIAYAHERFADDISVDFISREFGISRNYFSWLFTKRIGISFVDFLNRIRIERAKDLLLSTAAPVHEIAGKVGFENPSYFTRVFSKLSGMSPSDFRKNTAAKSENTADSP